MSEVCWRHALRAYLIGAGSVMDLSGRGTRTSMRRLTDDAMRCPRCQAKWQEARRG